ncbi:MAG: hypothetical protein ACLGI6_07805 [Gammaproteobacteria bacterium]
MPPPHDPTPQAGAAELPFTTLLYRFFFFGWLFRDTSAARNLYERHAALQHNRRMCKYFPTYLRRWSFVTAFDFCLGFLAERALQASVLSAWFFTCSCVTLTGMVVMSVAWVFLANGKVN